LAQAALVASMQIMALSAQILFFLALRQPAVVMVVTRLLAIPQVQAAMAALAAVRQGHLVVEPLQAELQHPVKEITAVAQVTLVLDQRMAVVVVVALAQLVEQVI
jgi:hypothetical protein